MTRPALRMCARCQRSTAEPVLVHQIHAPTGPGFNVYACPDCATHYPSPTGPLEIPAPAGHRSRLTLHVYKINTAGAVTEDRGKVEILADEHITPGFLHVGLSAVQLPEVQGTALANQNPPAP